AAINLHAGFQVNDGARTSAMGPENLFARVGNLYGSFRRASRHSSNDFQWNDFALAAEAATNKRLYDADLRHRHLQHQRKLVLQVVRNLRRRPHSQSAKLA